ncbi:polar amino acid ABC transporter, inner membrane subunit [Stanieria sp. NIES-3757]|nr:polar amino acid ABC transporter, inner membrane subunit [Stanieria sp. NIES-3757]
MSATNLKPVEQINLGRWLKNNLFSSWYNTLLTIVSLFLIYWLGLRLIHWAFFQAQWQVIDVNLRLFFIGRYPVKDIWRTWATLGVIVGLGGISWGILAQATSNLFNRRILVILGIITATCIAIAIPAGQQSSLILVGMVIEFAIAGILGKQLGKKIPQLKSWLSLLWLLAFFINLWLLLGISNVKLDNLSGLILTILVAVVSIVLCFPLGVLLALGRQSNLPIIRWLSIAYIEVIRGLPLIGILFMAQVMLPLVLPSYVRPDRVVRAIAGFTIFSSAYLAENVRGGLQSIPRGQTEAAKALGLNPLLTLVFIILPQALKAVIPSIVGQFISLFKDTSLLAIVGLVDLLGISQAILANPKFLGRYGEVYIFIAAIYWICCYSMSLASRNLEQQLGTLSHQGR